AGRGQDRLFPWMARPGSPVIGPSSRSGRISRVASRHPTPPHRPQPLRSGASMKVAMIGLILSAALLASVMLFRPEWLTPESQRRPSAARPWAKCDHPADPRIPLLARRKAAKTEVARCLFHAELSLLEAAEWFRLLNRNPLSPEDVAVKAQPAGDEGER